MQNLTTINSTPSFKNTFFEKFKKSFIVQKIILPLLFILAGLSIIIESEVGFFDLLVLSGFLSILAQ